MFERFTKPARETVRRAYDEAKVAGVRYIGTEHVLLGLLVTDRGPAFRVLTSAGVTADRVRSEVARHVGQQGLPLGPDDAEALKAIGIDLDAVIASVEQTFGPGALDELDDEAPARGRRGLFRRRGPATSVARPRFTPRAKKVLELSLREAMHRKDDYIGPEHILLGLFREGDGLAAKILTDAGLSLTDLRDRLDGEMRDAA